MHNGEVQMRTMFYVTYDIVTPESAEEGDIAENGFVTPGGGRDPVAIVPMGAADYAMTLRDAVHVAGEPSYDCGRWFEVEPYCEDYRTGAEVSFAIHPPRNVTPSSYVRLRRLFNITP